MRAVPCCLGVRNQEYAREAETPPLPIEKEDELFGPPTTSRFVSPSSRPGWTPDMPPPWIVIVKVKVEPAGTSCASTDATTEASCARTGGDTAVEAAIAAMATPRIGKGVRTRRFTNPSPVPAPVGGGPDACAGPVFPPGPASRG